jgi:hypothetical protein
VDEIIKEEVREVRAGTFMPLDDMEDEKKHEAFS